MELFVGRDHGTWRGFGDAGKDCGEGGSCGLVGEREEALEDAAIGVGGGGRVFFAPRVDDV